MTIELATTTDRERFIDSLQAAFRRADGKNKFRTEDLPNLFDKMKATLLDIIADKKSSAAQS